MRHKYLIILLLITNYSFAQLAIQIKEVSLANIEIVIDENEFIEGLDDGPVIDLRIHLINLSDTTISIHPFEADYYFLYHYRDSEYTIELDPYLYDNELEVVNIYPRDTLEIGAGSYLFLGTQLLSRGTYDYRNKIIEILPTSKLIYRGDGIRLESCGIEKVTVM